MTAIEGEIVPAGRSLAPRPSRERRLPTLDTAGPPRGVLLPAYVDHADPDELVPLEVDQALLDAIPTSTIETTTYQWGRFVRWCGDQTREHDPPTIGTIRFYIWAHLTMVRRRADGREVLCGRRGRPYSPNTVRTALGVICSVLQWRGYASPWKHPGVQKQLEAYDQTWAGMGHTPDIAHACTLDEHVATLRSRDMETVAGIRDAAMIAMQGATGMRAGEVVALDLDDLSWETPERLNVQIRWSKTKKPRLVPVEADPGYAPDVCAIALLNRYLEVRAAAGFGPGPLWLEVRSGQRAKSGLSGRLVNNRCTRHGYEQAHAKAVKAAGVGVDPQTGKPRHYVTHSERAGYITRASDAGEPVERIAPVTGHSPASPVIHRYVRTGRRWGEHNPGTVARQTAIARREAKKKRAEAGGS